VQQREDELKNGGDVQKLILEKSQLEQTLVSLSEEVEVISQKNEKLLRDLQKKDYYKEYHQL
jgi:hypothetical protein